MERATRQGLNLGLSSLGFVLITLAAYLSALVALSYELRSIKLPRASILIAIGIAYLVIGVYGFALSKRAQTLSSALIYFVVQILLAATLLFLTKAPSIMMAMLPLAGQSVVLLPRRWMLAICVLLFLALFVPVSVRVGWQPAAVLDVFFLAGIIFVVVLTQLVVNEQRARREVERLAAELRDANSKLREYMAQVEELATTKERNRLAREIHDSLGHYLTVINVQIEAARVLMESDRLRSLDALGKAQTLAQEGLTEVRRSVTALRASPTENRPLAEALSALVDECRAAGVSTEFLINGTPRSLSTQAELTLYRAAQEGLTNVRKHARARHASLTLDYTGEVVRLVIQDDGVGGAETNKGFGLLGVRERAQQLGGEVRVRTEAGQGFILEVGVPG